METRIQEKNIQAWSEISSTLSDYSFLCCDPINQYACFRKTNAMGKRTLILLGTSFLLFLVAATIRYVSFNDMRTYTHDVERSRELIVSLEKLSNHLKSTQIVPGDSADGSRYHFFEVQQKESALIQKELVKVGRLVQQHRPNQQIQYQILNATVRRQLPLMLRKNARMIAGSQDRSNFGALLRINNTIRFMVQQEEAALEVKARELENALAWTDRVSFALVLIALLIFGITFTHNLKLSRKERWLQGFLSSVLDTSRAGIVSFKAVRDKGRIVQFTVAYMNEAAGPILFGNDPTTTYAARMHEFIVQTQLFPLLQEVAETGANQQLEIPYQRGAETCWLQLLLARRDDGATLSIHDISAIKKYQEDLQQTITQLERSNAELEQYAYAASHDLQEPLRKITTFGHLLNDTQQDRLDEKGQRHLEKILAAASRMTSLIRDLLAFSSLKRKEGFEMVSLDEVLHNVQQDLELAITQKQVKVYAEPMPVVEAIPLQMHQLLYNLFNNAIKFASPHRNPEIRVSCTRLPGEERSRLGLATDRPYLQLVVADNGIGFDPSHAQQIFGLFKRLNNRELYSGSGIGLALCKRVMENHHGQIWAESKEGQGARFTLLIPEIQPGSHINTATLKQTA